MRETFNSTEVRTFGFRAPRFEVRFGFTLHVDSSHGSYEALCRDISEEGLAADLPETLAVDTPVTLTIVFPGTSLPLRIKARIEYRQGRRYGLSFLYSCVEERAEVQSFLESLRRSSR